MEVLDKSEKKSIPNNQQAVECCPVFKPEKWDDKSLDWDQKPFIKASVPTFFHVPFKKIMGKKITKMMRQVEEAQKMESDMDNLLLLFHDPHAFRSDMYLSVTGSVPEALNTSISGTFIAKVYEGPYKEIPKFMKQMKTDLAIKEKKIKEFYIHYAYCPKCAAERGHNYMILFAQVS